MTRCECKGGVIVLQDSGLSLALRASGTGWRVLLCCCAFIFLPSYQVNRFRAFEKCLHLFPIIGLTGRFLEHSEVFV